MSGAALTKAKQIDPDTSVKIEVMFSLTFEHGNYWVGTTLWNVLSYEECEAAIAAGPTLSSKDGKAFLHLAGHAPKSIDYGHSLSPEMGDFGCWPESGNRLDLNVRMDSQMELTDFLRTAPDLSLFTMTFWAVDECEETRGRYSKTIVDLRSARSGKTGSPAES